MLTAQMVESLHRSAQAQLGVVAAFLSDDSFAAVDVVSGRGLDGWADLVASQVVELRGLSGELAQTAYQLGRWLETGRVLGEPMGGARSGAELAGFFFDLVEGVASLDGAGSSLGRDVASARARGVSEVPLGLDGLREAVLSVRDSVVEDKPLEVDPFEWATLRDDIAQDVADRLKQGTELYTKRLSGDKKKPSMVQNLTRHINLLRATYDGEELQQKLAEVKRGAGSRGSGIADQLVMNAGRDKVLDAAGRDRRVLLWARGTSNNPCGFCAMLASRGFDYAANERDRASGAIAAHVRSYHPNCHCYPIFRWSDSSELPPVNRFLSEMWPDVTAGYSGKDARNKWRTWLNAHKRRNGGVINVDDSQEG